MASQPANDLDSGPALVVLRRTGDRPEALEEGEGLVRLQGVEEQGRDAWQGRWINASGNEDVDVIAGRQGPAPGLLREQEGIIEVVDHQERRGAFLESGS